MRKSFSFCQVVRAPPRGCQLPNAYFFIPSIFLFQISRSALTSHSFQVVGDNNRPHAAGCTIVCMYRVSVFVGGRKTKKVRWGHGPDMGSSSFSRCSIFLPFSFDSGELNHFNQLLSSFTIILEIVIHTLSNFYRSNDQKRNNFYWSNFSIIYCLFRFIFINVVKTKHPNQLLFSFTIIPEIMIDTWDMCYHSNDYKANKYFSKIVILLLFFIFLSSKSSMINVNVVKTINVS